MNTETVTVLPKGEDFEIIVQHDQSGSAYGMTLSNSAYEQLRLHFVMCSAKWDTDIENIGLPSNMHFSFGSEFGDIVYRLQKTKNVRWCVFSVDRNYYVIEQQSVNGEWVENWTKQMNKSRDEAKAYAENELTKHYA